MRPPAPAQTLVHVHDLGVQDYGETLALQRRLAAEKREALLLVEHPPVFTRGTSCRGSEAPSLPHPVFDVERGGDWTYHGPGQLVGYPIVDLRARRLRVGQHLRAVESALLAAMAELGVRGEAVPGFTGVWVQGRKVASIGIAVKGWTAYHGFALNVRMDLAPFALIRPCKLEPDRMASLHQYAPGVTMERAKEAVRAAFAQETPCTP